MAKLTGRQSTARSRVLALTVLSMIAGCKGESKAPGNLYAPDGSISHRNRPAELQWVSALPSQGAGLAIHPQSGLLYVTVAQGGAGAFRRGGGLLTLNPAGAMVSELPIVAPTTADGLCPVFNPNAPVISPDGSAIYVGDNAWNAYFYSTGLNYLFDVRPHGQIRDEDRIAGISGAGEIDIVASRVLIPGRALYSLDMTDGEVRLAREFENPVQQIVRMSSRRYALNLSAPDAGRGRVALWNPMNDRVKYFDLPNPVFRLTSAQGWNVALVSEGDACVISELKVEESARGPQLNLKKIVSFLPISRKGCRDYRLALGPISKRVLVGGESQAFAVRAEDGSFSSLPVERVRGVAISPDESVAYVVESGRIQAFGISESK